MRDRPDDPAATRDPPGREGANSGRTTGPEMAVLTDKGTKIASLPVREAFSFPQWGDEMIIVDRLSKSFYGPSGPIRVLHDVSFRVERGEIFGIYGPSGVGKTTLLRCLSFLEKPDSGDIFISGERVSSLTGKEVRDMRLRLGLSVVFQGYNLLSSRTALDNVLLPLEIRRVPREEARAKAGELLRLTGLDSRWNFYPSSLSGGEKQRVAIARALVTEPRVLLLDEPTSALDRQTAVSVLRLVEKLTHMYSVTVLIVSHQLEVTRSIANRGIILSSDGSATEV